MILKFEEELKKKELDRANILSLGIFNNIVNILEDEGYSPIEILPYAEALAWLFKGIIVGGESLYCLHDDIDYLASIKERK